MTSAEIIAAGFAFDPGMGQRRTEFGQFLDFLRAEAPQRILEIGAGRGGSAHVWGQIAPDRVVSVDLPNGEGGSPLAACEARNARLLALFPQFLGLLGSSQDPAILEAARTEGPYDLVFVDGDHSLRAVRADDAAYRPLVRPGGLIAYHDWNSRAAPGVAQFWHEQWEGCPDARVFTEHGDWGGIGVVRV